MFDAIRILYKNYQESAGGRSEKGFSAETIPGGYSGATFRLAMRDHMFSYVSKNVVAVIRKYAFVWGFD